MGVPLTDKADLLEDGKTWRCKVCTVENDDRMVSVFLFYNVS